MNKPTTFYVVRHGETDWNVKRQIQGHTDIPLNANGEMQAKEMGKLFGDTHFDLAISSDLLRAKRTAEIIALEKKLAVATTERLRERSFGTLEGKPSSIFQTYHDLLKELTYEERFKHRFEEGVESDEQVVDRLVPFLKETAVAAPGKTVLVVAHGGILRVLLTHLGFFSYPEADESHVNNAAYIKLTSDGTDFSIIETKGIEKRS